MTPEQLKQAKVLSDRIYRLNLHIKNIESYAGFVNDADIREAPETTAAMKQLILPDLRAKLAAVEAEFVAL